MADDKPPAAFSDSDQAWFDRLSRGPQGAPAGRAEREADALNRALVRDEAAMQADPAIAEATTDAAREQRWQQLQFRLRREQAQQQRSPWLRRGGFAAMAASLLLAVVVIQRMPDDKLYYDEPPTMRGDVELLRLSDAQPRQAAEALAQALRDAGLPAALHQNGKVFSVDAVVAADTPEAALQLLKAKGSQGTPGPKRLEFAPR